MRLRSPHRIRRGNISLGLGVGLTQLGTGSPFSPASLVDLNGVQIVDLNGVPILAV